MFTEQQVLEIEKYMPLVRSWAIKFTQRKNGEMITDVDDYVQAAFEGLTRYVLKWNVIKEEDFGLLMLYIKKCMFIQAYSMSKMTVPRTVYKRFYCQIEKQIDSVEALQEAMNNEFGKKYGGGMGSLWPSTSEISIDERIDLKDTIKSLKPSYRQIYDMLSTGMNILEVSTALNKGYATVYEQVENIRKILREKAPLSFLEMEEEFVDA